MIIVVEKDVRTAGGVDTPLPSSPVKTRHYAQRPTITRATYPALPASKPIGSHPQTGTLATSVTNALIVQSEVAGNGDPDKSTARGVA